MKKDTGTCGAWLLAPRPEVELRAQKLEVVPFRRLHNLHGMALVFRDRDEVSEVELVAELAVEGEHGVAVFL